MLCFRTTAYHRYDDAFYSAVITRKVFSLAAVYRPAGCCKEFDAKCNKESDQPEQKEFIAGIITASQEIGSHLRFHVGLPSTEVAYML